MFDDPQLSADTIVQDRTAILFDDFFHPRSVAVVGASSRASGGGGNTFLQGLIDHGFPGPIYPVNPRADVILGRKAYPDLLSVPDPLDYVISSIPAVGVPELLRQAIAKGVRLVHLYTAGFSESGVDERAGLEQEILRLARAGGVRLVGPNCMGLYCPSGHISWRGAFPTEPGPVGVVSQSGANGDATVLGGAQRGLRYSKVISFGNGLDLNESDLFEFLANDPDTEIIGCYLEGVKDGRRFRGALERAASRKPVVVLKGGRTEAGGRAAASHTGSLAGSSAMWDALCKQTGAVRVFGMDELVDTLTAFRFLPEPPAGPRVAIVGGGGGHSVLAADECAAEGLTVPWFSASVQSQLSGFVPLAGTSVRNPLDTSVALESEANFVRSVEIVSGSGEVDFILAHLPGSRRDASERSLMEAARVVVAGARASRIPVVVVIRGFGAATAEDTQEMIDYCSAAGLAVFPSVAQAAAAVQKVRTYYTGRSARGR